MVANFAHNLRIGDLGQSAIARWLVARENCLVPAYQKEISEGKGPQFFTPHGDFVAPDLFIMPAMEWGETKHKRVFTWHRKTR